MTALKPKYMNLKLYLRLIVVAVIAGLLAACSASSKEEDKKSRLEKLKANQADIAKEIAKLQEEIAKETPDSVSTMKTKDVTVVEVKSQKFDHYVQTQGRVESENNVLVSARSMGVITQVFVNEGDQVSKGQVLAQIDNSVMMRNIEGLKSQLELATSVYDRQKNLWDQKIGTEVQFLQAKTQKEGLEKQVAAAQEQIEMTRIKAPLSGVVDEVSIKVGENIAPGMPAARIINNADLKITANVSEAYVTRIKKNNPIVISIPELGKDVEAKLTFVGRNIDPLTRTFGIEAKLPSREELRPNMTAVVRVVFQSFPSAIVVPVNLIQDIDGEKVVFVAETKGKQLVARKKVLTVEGVYNGKAQVTGLEAGEKVISAGFQGLSDGQFIKI